MIALVLQSAPKKDFAIAKVREGAAGGQMQRLSKEFESVNKKEFVVQNVRKLMAQTALFKAILNDFSDG